MFNRFLFCRVNNQANLSIAEALRHATRILQTGETFAPREDAGLLLRYVLQCDKTFLLAHDDYFLSASEREKFFELVQRRAQNEPLQHLTGTQEFFGLEFEVSKDVLIPRPETEILVEIALEILRPLKNPCFCEVGIGSGCVSIAVLKNLENATAVGLDISPAALEIARRNAEKHQVAECLQMLESDMFSVIEQRKSESENQKAKFDLILSNPPYIPDGEARDLKSEVRDFEPANALFAGADGFDIIRRLLRDAPKFLHENGILTFECGFGQAEKLSEIIDKKTWELLEVRRDLQKIPRTAVLRLMK